MSSARTNTIRVTTSISADSHPKRSLSTSQHAQQGRRKKQKINTHLVRVKIEHKEELKRQPDTRRRSARNQVIKLENRFEHDQVSVKQEYQDEELSSSSSREESSSSSSEEEQEYESHKSRRVSSSSSSRQSAARRRSTQVSRPKVRHARGGVKSFACDDNERKKQNRNQETKEKGVQL